MEAHLEKSSIIQCLTQMIVIFFFVPGLYVRLPGYLTNVSVQTSDSMGVMEEHGYNRCENLTLLVLLFG